MAAFIVRMEEPNAIIAVQTVLHSERQANYMISKFNFLRSIWRDSLLIENERSPSLSEAQSVSGIKNELANRFFLSKMFVDFLDCKLHLQLHF